MGSTTYHKKKRSKRSKKTGKPKGPTYRKNRYPKIQRSKKRKTKNNKIYFKEI